MADNRPIELVSFVRLFLAASARVLAHRAAMLRATFVSLLTNTLRYN